MNAPVTEAPVFIPRERYTEESFARLEWKHVWPHSWLLAAREAELPSPGAWRQYELGRQSVLLLRDDSGVRAFHNACTHRGTRLLSERAGSGLQCVRCPYHHWEWHLDGRLKRLSDGAHFGRVGNPAELGLAPVRCESWQGFLWVNFDLEGPSLVESLGTLAARLEPYELGKHTLVRDVTVEWNCNWKVAMDNGNETYHVQAIHPQLLDLLDDVDTRPEVHGDHSCFWVRVGHPSHRLGRRESPPTELGRLLRKFDLREEDFAGKLEQVRPAMEKALRAQFQRRKIDYPGLTDAELVDNFHVHLFPNTMFNIMLPGYWLFRARPHPTDPQKMYFDFQDYERMPPGAPAPAVKHEHYRSTEVALDTVLDQDAAIMERIQQGMNSLSFDGLLLGALESRLAHMHEVLERRIYGAAGAGRERRG